MRLWAWKLDARRVLEGHERFVYWVTFSPDGFLIASSDWDNRICLWHALTGERLATLPGIGANEFLNFTTDGNRLIDTGLWDTAAGVRLTAPRLPEDERIFKNSRNPGPKISLSQLAAQGGARFGRHKKVALSHDRTLVVNGFHSGEIQIRERATDRPIRLLGRHDSLVYTVAFSPDDRRLVSGDTGGIIKAWDLVRGEELACLTGHEADVFSLVFSPDGKRIASGSNDGTIILWNADTFEKVAVLRGHTSYVHSVAFSPDGTMLVSGSGDSTVRIWDTVPRAERLHQVRRIEALEADAEVLVSRLCDEFDDPLDVADRLRRDETLDGDLRGAALNVLLRRSCSR